MTEIKISTNLGKSSNGDDMPKTYQRSLALEPLLARRREMEVELSRSENVSIADICQIIALARYIVSQ